MSAPALTPEQAAAIDAARALAAAGIPVFLAAPDAASSTGFALPRNWQNTAADAGVVDRWRPGMAIAAVMGQGLDVIDIDPRNGGDVTALNGRTPIAYGAALTPSGGVHSFIRSLGVAKKTNLMPGIDIQAGAPDGTGRGFVFLAPTVRVSKVTGQPVPYRWAMPPDLARYAQGAAGDVSGLALAELVRNAVPAAGTASAAEFMKAGPWVNIEATLAEGRNNGVAKLAAALRGRGGWRQDDAVRFMYAEVWPLIDQAQGGHDFSAEEFEATIAAAFKQYPDGTEQRIAEAAVAPTPAQPPSLLRYFTEKNALQAATLAADVASLGPLANGVDDVMWAYRGGVWRPAKHVVRDRVTFLLGERYRPGHKANTEDIVRSRLPTIACDPIPELVNLRNGLLDWRTGALREHTPDVLSTVQLNVDYDPGAQCPAFERFVSQVVPPDVVETVWELIGYLMYSGNPLHKAVMLTGTGRNGKGTFLRVMVALLGRQNVTTASLHDLVNTRFTTASLFGKLANIAGDIDGSYLETTATLKGITGGDMISAEHKNRDRFDFSPWAVPVFSANKIPGSADTTVGYLSRWLIVNFPHDFTGHEDRSLDTVLHTPGELAGIAVRGLAALPRLLDRGDFVLTDSARAAREDFVRRVDQVRTWLFDCTDISPEHPWLPRTELYQNYQRWAARDGHRPVKASEFYDRIEAAGAAPAIVHGTRGFKGIKIIDGGYQAHMGAQGAGGPNSFQYVTPPLSTTPVPPTAPAPAPAPSNRANTANPTLSDEKAPRVQVPGESGAPDENPVNTDVPKNLGAEGAASRRTPPNSNAPARTHAHNECDGPAPVHPTPAGESVSAGITRRLLEAKTAAQVRPLAQELDRPTPTRAPDSRVLGGRSPDRQQTRAKLTVQERAAAKAAAKAEVLAAKIAEAAGEPVRLPAVVTRDGTVRPVELKDTREILTAFGWPGRLTVDVETTGYPIGHADYGLRTIQIGGEHAAIVFDAHDQAHLGAAGLALNYAEVLHAHSATADLVPLAAAGVLDLERGWDRMHDTVIPAKLADPASTGSDPGLKQLAGAMLGEAATAPAAAQARTALFKAGKWLTDTKATTPLERSGWAQVDSRCTTMVRYAASDVLDTAALARVLPAVPPAVLERERTAQRMTARVTHRGLRIDGEHVAELLSQQRAALADAGQRLRAFGIDNPGSDAQVGAVAAQLGASLPRTKTGKASVAKGVLGPYGRSEGLLGDFVQARLDYQKAETGLGLFLEPYHELVTRGDGRARPTIYTLGAATGRMAAVRPNLQQVPRQGGYRACITADPGELLVTADFAGVEVRVATALSGDVNLLRMITEGVDLHWLIAREVYGPDATKEDRYNTKRGVFGRLYGSGIPGIAATLGIPEALAASTVEVLDALTPQLAAWTRDLKQAVQRGMRTFETYSGRVIHLDPRLPHKALNFAVQGTARELLVDTLVRWQDTRWGTATLLPVHDEILLAVPEAEAADATAALVAAMETELYGVPIKAEASEPSFEWKDAS